MKKTIYILVFVALIICIGKVYAYTEYKIGDEVTYNEIKYYVIKDSSSSESSVTMLKAEPLTEAEVNQHSVGHVNRYTYFSIETAYNYNDYGGMAYYSSDTCGYVNNDWVYDGCITSYAQSEIKYVVDDWKHVQAPAAIEARLITFEELTENLGIEYQQIDTDEGYKKTDDTPNFIYNGNYWYWTSSSYGDSMFKVWYVSSDGSLYDTSIFYIGHGGIVVRPVITLSKTVLKGADESIIDDDTDKGNDKLSKVDSNDTKGLNTADNETSEIKSTVKVDNTYMRNSIITIIIGFIIASISVFILYKLRNKAK